MQNLDPGFERGQGGTVCAAHGCFFEANCGYRRISAASPQTHLLAKDGGQVQAQVQVQAGAGKMELGQHLGIQGREGLRSGQRTWEYQVVHA